MFATVAIAIGTGVAAYFLGGAFLVAAGLAGVGFALYHGLKEPSAEIGEVEVGEVKEKTEVTVPR